MARLEKIAFSGFKSIGSRQEISFGTRTLLIGANGSGKSNFISFFSLLNHLVTGGLQSYIARNGMANSILHFGPAVTKTISFEATFSSKNWENTYKADLTYGMSDILFLAGEEITAKDSKNNNGPISANLSLYGSPESELVNLSPNMQLNNAMRTACKITRDILSRCRVFQFHNTSPEARIRNTCPNIHFDTYLASDAGNLPAFLYAMKTNHLDYYRRIVEYVRSAVPQFRDFSLSPSSANPNCISLTWVGERGDDYVFGPHQLSDGSLRFIALAALLLQPKDIIPDVIILDEPELGLHPEAVSSLVGMIAIASEKSQVIVATQSRELVDFFDPSEIVISEYDKKANESRFHRLDPDALALWLEEYSLAELWDKNLIGGRP